MKSNSRTFLLFIPHFNHNSNYELFKIALILQLSLVASKNIYINHSFSQQQSTTTKVQTFTTKTYFKLFDYFLTINLYIVTLQKYEKYIYTLLTNGAQGAWKTIFM